MTRQNRATRPTKDLCGVSGVITIDSERNTKKPIVIVQMKNEQPAWVADIANPGDLKKVLAEMKEKRGG